MKNGAGLGALLWAAATHSNETIVHSCKTILRIVPPVKILRRNNKPPTHSAPNLIVIPNRAPKECEEGPYVCRHFDAVERRIPAASTNGSPNDQTTNSQRQLSAFPVLDMWIISLPFCTRVGRAPSPAIGRSRR